MSLKRRTFVTFLPLIALLVLLASCAARQIRAAQDAFSDGARIENAERAAVLFGAPQRVDSPSDGISATVSYRTALQLLDTELKDHKSDLDEEKLLGPAMMLRAMTLWRLADLEAGSNSAPNRKELDAAILAATTRDVAEQLGSRDRVMADALPGLFDHDRGMWAKRLDDAQRFFSSAYWVVDAAITNSRSRTPPVAETHPVMTYLRLAQLATLRSWQSAIMTANPSSLPDSSGSEDDKTLDSIVNCFGLITEKFDRISNPAVKDLVDAMKRAFGRKTLPLNESTCSALRKYPQPQSLIKPWN